MIIDSIYTAISNALLVPVAPATAAPTPARMVDWYNGQPEQLESDAPKVDAYLYPLVLVRYDPPQWRGNGRRGYWADLQLYIDVVQWPDARMASDVPTAERARSRSTYDTVHSITKALVALRGDGFGPLKLTTTVLDHAFKKIRVDTSCFKTMVKTDMDPRTWQRVRPALADTYTMR